MVSLMQDASLCLSPGVFAGLSDHLARYASYQNEEPGSKQINEDLNLGTPQSLLSRIDGILSEPFNTTALDKSTDYNRNKESDAAGMMDVDAGFENMDAVGLIACDCVVRSAEVLLGTTPRPAISQNDFGAVAVDEMIEDPELKSGTSAPLIVDATVDQGIMDRFLCHVRGFEYNEPGFSCWISCCRCSGDACRNTSPWSPPPTALERRMCEPRMAGIMQSLIDQARAAEAERRRASLAKDARIAAAWADARAAAASAGTAAGAPASAVAGRSSLKRAMANGGGGGGKRGRACAR